MTFQSLPNFHLKKKKVLHVKSLEKKNIFQKLFLEWMEEERAHAS